MKKITILAVCILFFGSSLRFGISEEPVAPGETPRGPALVPPEYIKIGYTVPGSVGLRPPSPFPVPPFPNGIPNGMKPRSAHFIESPDILNINVTNQVMVPKAPYRLHLLDIVSIDVTGTPADDPLNGIFCIEPDGKVELGSGYGSVKIEGLFIEQAQEALTKHLARNDENPSGALVNPVVAVKLQRMGDMQRVNGNYVVEPDGYIWLGSYGRIYVSGLTVPECKQAFEFHLSKFMENPQVSVDRYSFDSKNHSVVIKKAYPRVRLFRFPVRVTTR